MKVSSLVAVGFHFGTIASANEVVLYDCDFSNSSGTIGQPVPLAGIPFPGRTSFSELTFGNVNVESAPQPWTGKAAVFHATKVGTKPFFYSQVRFDMVAGWCAYAFRKHRIELTFRFLNPSGLTGGDGLNILTDGGVTYSLFFAADGKAYLTSNKPDPYDPSGTVFDYSEAGAFDSSSEVQLVWEMDSRHGSSTVTVNGITSTFSGLAQTYLGARNQNLFNGPLWIRLNHEDADSNAPVAVKSIRIVGDDYDGPILDAADLTSPYVERDVVNVPFKIPSTGTWQPEFSMDGSHWVQFGGTLDSSFPAPTACFGKRVSPKMFIRLIRVD